VTESETVSVAPTPPKAEQLSDAIELGDGHLTFEIPPTWNAEFEDLTAAIIADESAPEFNERPAHRAAITNPAETVRVDVFTNVPWPDVVAIDPDEVELLHAEQLDLGHEPVGTGDGMWLRSVIAENPDIVDPRPTHGAFDERF